MGIYTKTNLNSGWYCIVDNGLARWVLGRYFFFHDDLPFVVQFAIKPKSPVS